MDIVQQEGQGSVTDSFQIRYFSDIIFKSYLEKLISFQVVKAGFSPLDECKKIRMNLITKIVYDGHESNLKKLCNVFASMAAYDCSIVLYIKSDGTTPVIYLGTKSESGNTAHAASEMFKGALQGNFPGLETTEVYANRLRDISASFQSEDVKFISAVSGIPDLKSVDVDGDSFVQGLEKIIEGLNGKPFQALLLATPVSREKLASMEAGYQDLYTALSSLESQQKTYSVSESDSMTSTFGQSFSSALADTVSHSQSHTHGTSRTTTTGTSHGKTCSSSLSSGFGNGLTKFAGNVAKEAFKGVVAGFSSSETRSSFESVSVGESSSDTATEGTSKTTTSSRGENRSESRGVTAQRGETHQLTIKNRRVSDILASLDEQLARIRKCKNNGMWNFATYFLGPIKSTTQIGADIMSGVLSGEGSGIERNVILSFDPEEIGKSNFDAISDSLSCFEHPVFDTSPAFPFLTATPTSFISSQELSVGMSLPQKSLPGIPVFESVEFGRAITSYDDRDSKLIKLGQIQHLGKVYEGLQVPLAVDSLTSHTFITGSTGAGKSNSVYSLIHECWKLFNIPFLIVEPAKGEYKNIFGGYKGVHTFGTNPFYADLLQLNPFSFPEQIHITEHIDRLIEILSAVWPMYAAMPAIFKAAVEKTYESLGWNLITSKNQYGRYYPDFCDLLEILPQVIRDSAFSDEVKGNYVGALVARVESLTNGFFRTIFQKNETSPEFLFDKPCIVDLSRVSSSETKSLLMGLLFMKLQEHRFATQETCNAQLKHLTVLEEAHNLLRRTSSQQGAEGANLQGKAVEMISNAIAEMRTYGEGFVIADQAPGLLDPSVIRNTNTKIIHRLPDWDDRELVGRAANLKGEQIEELAKLRTGCAAVYQNNWQEAVLCQVKFFDEDKVGKKLKEVKGEYPEDPREQLRQDLIRLFIKMDQEHCSFEAASIMLEVSLCSVEQYFPQLVRLRDERDFAPFFPLMKKIFRIANAVHLANAKHYEEVDSVYVWARRFLSYVIKGLGLRKVAPQDLLSLIHILFVLLSREDAINADFWRNEVGKESLWENSISSLLNSHE